jgi:predicted house-cleaning NTP pyrophosphatase (Maf/HAM1 superfamily)
MLFGIFRFPTAAYYWHAEEFLRGGIEICMQEGRYRFIENNLMTFSSEIDVTSSLHLTSEIRKKWKKMYKPDQELILLKHAVATHNTHLLMDSETLFILDEAIIFQEQSKVSIQQMLMNFSGKNHLLYFSVDCIDIRLVCSLAEFQIYSVGELTMASLQHDEESRNFAA